MGGKARATKKALVRVRRGFRIQNAKASVLINEIQRLGKGRKFESVTPEMLVREAQSPKSPLHNLFEWNDQKAATQYRLQQAEYYLRALEIVFINADGKEVSTRALHAVFVEEEDEVAYVHSSYVYAEEDLARQVIQDARRELEGWSQRYYQYQQLRDVAKKVRSLAKSMQT